MNNQNKRLLEILALLMFIGGICLLVWNVNLYPYNTKPKVIVTAAKDENWEEGRLLFRSYCNSCHYPEVNGIGPPLSGAKARWASAGSYQGKTGDQWMKIWVRNWKEPVAAGYPYAVMMAKSRETEMNYFTNLTDRQIDLILRYADSSQSAVK